MPDYLSQKQEFLKLFNSTARHRNRHEVFADFIKSSAIALHNAVAFCQEREDMYLALINKYDSNEVQNLCHMLSCVVNMLEHRPYDVLGELYTELELTNKNTSQFFTPFHVSELCAKLTFEDKLAEKPFITVSDPAVGAGSMLLAIVGEVVEHGYNPCEKMFCEGVDIDEVVALCAYIQLTLWNVPARIIIGDSLSMEYRQQWYTPAYYLFNWQEKLQAYKSIEAVKSLLNAPVTERSSNEDESVADVVVPREQIPLF